MREYAQRCPPGEDRYTESEAVATVRSAYLTAPREPAKSSSSVMRSRPAVAIAAPPASAATELRDYLHSVADGRVVDARMPWPLLSRWSCSMLPGTVTAVVGDPGVGKTFLTLECLRFWHGNGHDTAVFFVEKDRRFHTQRLLAQLEGNGQFVDYEWLPGKAGEVDAAIERHGAYIAELGKCIHSASGEDVSLDDLLNWVRQMASSGKRVLVIDPVTAADAGRERWEADRKFMVGAQKVCAAHGTSLVLVTHPRRGNRPATGGTLHDVAGGAAFVRLADTVLWLNKPKKSRKVRVRQVSSVGTRTVADRFGLFVQLHKTRNGMGNGMELAFSFGNGMRFCEHGVVIGEVMDSGEGEAA
jgi:KaiC/GvpD/RAD55 family RecA-like ATPase